MFWTNRQSSVEKKITHVHNTLAASFSNVKRDTQNIFRWLNFLYQKNMEQEHKIKQLQLELSYVPKRHEDIRKIIDNYYSFDHIMEKIRLLNNKIETIQTGHVNHTVHPRFNEMENRIKDLEEQRKATIREKVVKRITKNSRDYVRSLILSYIRKYGQLSGLQLKEMVVHDQGLCSKSSFYRLLEHIESMEEVGTAIKGKQKYYLYKPMKEH